MKKNIGLFNDSFPPVMDGVGICVQNYAQWMQKHVGGVSVITPANHGADYSDKEYEVLTYASVPVLMRPPYVTGISEIDPNFLRKILRREFKIVHAHCPFTSGATASRVARVQRIPMVATFHSKYKEDFQRALKNDLLVEGVLKYIVNFYESADEVWVPQESVKEVLRSYGYHGNIEVMQNGCDLITPDLDKTLFREESRKLLGIPADQFVLLFVGQHIWEKNVGFVIDALKQISDTNFHMYFVGRGYAAEKMKEMVSGYGLSEKVTFTGAITDREMLKRYYASANLFLFPSLYDTDGIVVREAAAFDTPSVMLSEASASGMLHDAQTGFLIDNSLDAFESKLRSLINDPAYVRSIGESASRSIVRSWEDIALEAIDRYNALISRLKLIK